MRAKDMPPIMDWRAARRHDLGILRLIGATMGPRAVTTTVARATSWPTLKKWLEVLRFADKPLQLARPPMGGLSVRARIV